ncbi:MAG: integrase [Acidovorax sp.]|nr:integrase [Acidovorax sp.]
MATNLATETPGQIINGLQPGPFKTLLKIKPSGALQARKQASGATALYWRYSIGTSSERVLIGMYDSSAAPKSLEPTGKGYSIAAATRAAEALSLEHHQHREEGGRPALVAAQKEAKAKEHAAKLEAEQYTLQSLLTDYADHLEAMGRVAHKDVRSIIKLHVFEPWPQVAALPANQVTGEQIADMMRRVIELGKARTSNKLRSYVRAAYQTAKAARSKASIPVKFKGYNVTHNPGADTEPDESANRADKRPLTADELRTYWQAIKALPGIRGAVLRLHLLTGGQRIEQLVNLRTENVSGDSIMLFDGKGRPGKPPRPHTVPLIPQAAAALLECKPQGAYAISTDKGVTHLAATTLSAWAVEATTLPDFQAKRIRSGVETILASARVSSEIRGRLQSHGIAGVQARHYDGHDYMAEKRQALETLFRLLDAPEATNVVQLKTA